MNTASIMRITLLALVPGMLIYIWTFGLGVALNLLAAIAVAVSVEALALRMRHQSLNQLRDGTVVVTAVLLALCLPPLLPFWPLMLGVILAVILGKHVYGGMGQNLFNPAMVGFAILIISFPLAMSQWPAPGANDEISDVLAAKLSVHEGRANYDGVTAATPLDAYKFRVGETNTEFFDQTQQNNWSGWAFINLGFLAGGLYLLYRKIIRWQAPVAMLSTIALLSLFFYDGGSSASLGSPGFHLFSGATMLAAFFVITDPVTGPANRNGLLIFGCGIGLVTYLIRTVGAYPEGIAFAVLLMNACAPLMDQLLTAQEQPV